MWPQCALSLTLNPVDLETHGAAAVSSPDSEVEGAAISLGSTWHQCQRADASAAT